MQTGERHQTKHNGWLTVVDYINTTHVDVEFIETGYRTTAHACNIRGRKVKDKLLPKLYGVGFVGDGCHKGSIKCKHTKSYKVWHSMMSRCYDASTQARYPTYKGCTVAKEWHNFQIFAEWFEANYIEGYQLDKDIIGNGKLYSPETCLFVTHAENSIEATAKHYVFTSPEGKQVEIYNLAKFCRDNNLNPGSMGQVNRGSRKQHKGWTKQITGEK